MLLRARITRAELGRAVKVHPNTVSNWSRGGPLPGPLVAYLELRAKVLALMDAEVQADE